MIAEALLSAHLLKANPVSFPDRLGHGDAHIKADKDCYKQGGELHTIGDNVFSCVLPPPPEPVAEIPATPAPVASSGSGGLTGTIGFSQAFGNCVNTAKAYGKNQQGNPISWVASTHTPFLGAAVLFYYNHVAIVSGIYPDGSIEVVQENSPGASHHLSPSEVRGYF